MPTQRLRDPIHDLITFDEADEEDMLAWELIKSKEFQRLRRVRQLGLSEFVFPGATHSRFAHSVGVYNNARRLLEVLRRTGQKIEPDRKQVILIAALLHDIGHGPFSHAFEKAREAVTQARGEEAILNHEKWSARLINADDGGIVKLIGKDMATKVGGLIAADAPTDVFHAVVSSSFDADRLDYVLRDRYMTGAGAGAIDQEWLIDNLTTFSVSIPQDDDKPQLIPTFVFKPKGRQAAEDFLLARYRLYSQIYLHKTTRGFEQLVTALFRYIGSDSTEVDGLGLQAEHPLLRFLRAKEHDTDDTQVRAKTGDFRRLDDMTVWSSIEHMTHCKDGYARDLANRLLWRKPLKVIDVTAKFGHNENGDAQINAERRIDDRIREKLDKSVFVDRAPLNLYSRIGGEVAKEHKKVRVLDGSGEAREITDFPDTIVSKKLTAKQDLVRYYFLFEEDRAAAEKAMNGG
jgi:uncharacterized protein